MSTSTYKALPWVALMSFFLTHAKCAELETAFPGVRFFATPHLRIDHAIVYKTIPTAR